MILYSAATPLEKRNFLPYSFHLPAEIKSSTDELNGVQKNGGKTLLVLEIPLQQKSGKVNLLEGFSINARSAQPFFLTT